MKSFRHFLLSVLGFFVIFFITFYFVNSTWNFSARFIIICLLGAVMAHILSESIKYLADRFLKWGSDN